MYDNHFPKIEQTMEIYRTKLNARSDKMEVRTM